MFALPPNTETSVSEWWHGRAVPGTPASPDIRVRESSRSSIVTSSARHGGESSPGGEEHCERRRVVMDDGPCAPICTPYAGGASKALGASSHGMWGRSTWKRTRRLRERVPSFALYSRQRTSCAHSQSVGYPPSIRRSRRCRSPGRSEAGWDVVTTCNHLLVEAQD
jgi:hypothetical protein